MTIGLMVQIVGYVMDGLEGRLVAEFAMVSLPETLQWTIPLALLVSSVLVFSRMSADSEIAAMRACGIHLGSVMFWPVVFALVCTLLGAFVNNEIVPRGHEIRRTLKTRVSVGSGLSVLEPGHVIDDFPKVRVYFSRKEGNWVYDLRIMDYSNPKIERLICASKALITSEGRDIVLDLYQMTIDPVDETNRSMAHASRFQYRVEDALRESKYTRRTKDFRFFELLSNIRAAGGKSPGQQAGSSARKAEREFRLKDFSSLKVEMSKRFVFAMAAICFVLVGVPLGIRAQRRESSIGMAISLAVALGYYLIVILMLSLEKNSAIRPELLIWLPVLACFVLSSAFIKKHL